MSTQLAADLAQVFAAARIAQLEMERLYDPVLHDPWFANFNWEAFSHDELSCLRPWCWPSNPPTGSPGRDWRLSPGCWAPAARCKS